MTAGLCIGIDCMLYGIDTVVGGGTDYMCDSAWFQMLSGRKKKRELIYSSR